MPIGEGLSSRKALLIVIIAEIVANFKGVSPFRARKVEGQLAPVCVDRMLSDADLTRIGNLLDEKLKTVERKIDEIEKKWSTEFNALSVKFERLDKMVEHLAERIEYQENQNRRENLVFLGLPSPSSHESWEDVRKTIVTVAERNGIDVQERDISRAHRLGSGRGGPAPVVAKFSTWYAKDKLLREGRKILKEKESIIVKEDWSAAVREKRKKLMDLQQAAFQDGCKTFFRVDRLHVGGHQFHVGVEGKVKCGQVDVLNVAEARLIWNNGGNNGASGEDARKRGLQSPDGTDHFAPRPRRF